MFASFQGHPFLQWVTTLLLEMTFLGVCIIFIGAGWTELQKRKNPFKNLVLICTGIVLALMSFYATYLLLI